MNGERRVLFTVSWLPNPSQSGNPVHYHVQLDDENPVVVQNTSVTLLTNASLEMNHTVRVEAVDMCEDRSPPAMIVMRTRRDGVTSTSISTVSEDTPPPQTAYQVDGMVIYTFTFNVFILAIYITQDLQAQYLFLSLLRYSSVWQLLESCLALAGLLLACLFLANLSTESVMLKAVKRKKNMLKVN